LRLALSSNISVILIITIIIIIVKPVLVRVVFPTSASF